MSLDIRYNLKGLGPDALGTGIDGLQNLCH